MPTLQGFIGPAYNGRSIAAAGDRCINLYPEAVESKQGQYILVGTPGLSLRHDLGDGLPVRGIKFTMGRCFAVVGTTLYEIFENPLTAPVSRGTVASSTLPATMECNATQLMVVSGSSGYILTLSTNVFAQITDPDFPAAGKVGILDGYFIIYVPSTRTFYKSALNDGTSWNALDYAVKEGDEENIDTFLVDHRELAIFGSKNIEVWYDSGNADFPFDRRPDAAIEDGIASPYSPVKLDNSFFWLSRNERGGVSAKRMQGYTPVRISNHAVEYQWSTYADIAAAVAYAYEQEGHQFWVINFEEATWVYDCATSSWHQRAYWNTGTAAYERHLVDCHCYAWGKHIVGDYRHGRIYVMDLSYYDDAGDAKRWIRSAPYIQQENRRLWFGRFELFFEPGVGLVSGQGTNPEVMRRYSNDGGYTWSAELTAG
jgi:hypothetical protein